MTTATGGTRSRLAGRSRVVARALALRGVARRAPAAPRRILVAHHLLLGDTLMLSPLLKKLRSLHPGAEIAMTMSPVIAPLYATRPWGVRALPFDPRGDLAPLFAEAPFDVAYVPGDNRYAWLAGAMRARWIVAFAGDRPVTKSWPVDLEIDYPQQPAAWGDMVATLAAGPGPEPYRTGEWRAPAHEQFEVPRGSYAVLHVGASSPLKRWGAERWAALAAELAARGVAPVWSAGRGEEGLVAAIGGSERFASFAGRLDLAQLWRLLAGARLLIAPDTGVAHLGRIVGVPTVALFGPGSALLCGAGAFWRDAPYRAVTVEPFACRDQPFLFKRRIAWVRRCARTPVQCPQHLCMPALGVADVLHAIESLAPLAAAPHPAPEASHP
ncbi:MAG: glycosyltransferase family 9 protein [Proteobacteria bacterium]|nr:glycosyltransferase family 9 protein [Pseudomonadota bacterium]